MTTPVVPYTPSIAFTMPDGTWTRITPLAHWIVSSPPVHAFQAVTGVYQNTFAQQQPLYYPYYPTAAYNAAGVLYPAQAAPSYTPALQWVSAPAAAPTGLPAQPQPAVAHPHDPSLMAAPAASTYTPSLQYAASTAASAGSAPQSQTAPPHPNLPQLSTTDSAVSQSCGLSALPAPPSNHANGHHTTFAQQRPTTSLSVRRWTPSPSKAQAMTIKQPMDSLVKKMSSLSMTTVKELQLPSLIALIASYCFDETRVSSPYRRPTLQVLRAVACATQLSYDVEKELREVSLRFKTCFRQEQPALSVDITPVLPVIQQFETRRNRALSLRDFEFLAKYRRENRIHCIFRGLISIFNGNAPFEPFPKKRADGVSIPVVVSDTLLRQICSIQNLTFLDLGNCSHVTNEGTLALQQLNNVKHLRFDSLSEKAVVNLTSTGKLLKPLESCMLTNCLFPLSTFKQIVPYLANTTTLVLSAPHLTDEWVTEALKPPKLERLSLTGAAVTAQAIAQIAQARTIKYLTLQVNRNISIEHLRPLQQLQLHYVWLRGASKAMVDILKVMKFFTEDVLYSEFPPQLVSRTATRQLT